MSADELTLPRQTLEEVARLHAGSRAGFTLVGCQEVGLPYWQLSLDCVILNRKEIPALAEFAMRAMAAGLETVEDIAGFLGLSEGVVASVLASLYQEDFVAMSSEVEGGFGLTAAGERLLAKCELVVPEETVFSLEYDGWTRRCVDLGNVVKYSPADLRKLGIWALPAFPADPPNADDITVAEVRDRVSKTLERRQKGTVVGADVLSVEGLHDKRHSFYRYAVALLFKSKQTGDAQAAFAVDGRLSREHEDAFAQAAGLKKLGVLDALRESAIDSASLQLDPSLIAMVTDAPEVVDLARQARGKRREVVRRQETLDKRPVDDVATDVELGELDEVREELGTIEAQLTKYPVRMLEVFEHPEVLEEALVEAQERLLIVSPWVKSAVVNDSFIVSLRRCLDRGVAVSIGYGINGREPDEGSDRSALGRLRGLAEAYSNLLIAPLGDTHSKVLVLDRRYVVVTSFNWLSFRGDDKKPFRDERGVLVQIPAKVDEVYSSMMIRIKAAVAAAEQGDD